MEIYGACFCHTEAPSMSSPNGLPAHIVGNPEMAAVILELLAMRRGVPCPAAGQPPVNSIEELTHVQLPSPVNSVNNWVNPAPDDDDNVSEGYETAEGSDGEEEEGGEEREGGQGQQGGRREVGAQAALFPTSWEERVRSRRELGGNLTRGDILIRDGRRYVVVEDHQGVREAVPMRHGRSKRKGGGRLRSGSTASPNTRAMQTSQRSSGSYWQGERQSIGGLVG